MANLISRNDETTALLDFAHLLQQLLATRSIIASIFKWCEN